MAQASSCRHPGLSQDPGATVSPTARTLLICSPAKRDNTTVLLVGAEKQKPRGCLSHYLCE